MIRKPTAYVVKAKKNKILRVELVSANVAVSLPTDLDFGSKLQLEAVASFRAAVFSPTNNIPLLGAPRGISYREVNKKSWTSLAVPALNVCGDLCRTSWNAVHFWCLQGFQIMFGPKDLSERSIQLGAEPSVAFQANGENRFCSSSFKQSPLLEWSQK